MSEKKNIDRLFQEGFKDFEVQPPSAFWDKIEEQLDQKKNRRVIPLWWTLAGVAAGLTILLTSLYLGDYNGMDNDQETIVNSQKETTTDAKDQNKLEQNKLNNGVEVINDKEHQISDSHLANEDSKIESESLKNAPHNLKENNRSSALLVKDRLLTAGDLSSDTPVNNKDKSKKLYAVSIKDKGSNTGNAQRNVSSTSQLNGVAVINGGNETSASLNEGVAVNNNSLNEESTIKNQASSSNKNIKDQVIDNAIAVLDSTKKKLPTLEEIAAQEKAGDSLNEEVFKGRWAATTQVGPVYSNSLSGSALNNEVSDNSRDPGLNLSYGLGLSYEISPRLSVRTGINQVNMTYSTRDINYQVNLDPVARGVSVQQTYSVNSVSNAIDVTNNNPITNNGLASGFAAEEFISNEFQGIKGELSQQLGYIEVPLELKYSLVNNKFKINVLGGMSALFLTDNVVAVQNSSGRLELGEDRNFSEFNQSANLGLGLGYDFTNNLGVFIEPSFKYQLSTLKNNLTDFRPYTIGIQSGVTYRF